LDALDLDALDLDARVAELDEAEQQQRNKVSSIALVANGPKGGAVIEYRGDDISIEMEEPGCDRTLEDLGFDDAPQGLSIWEGKFLWVAVYTEGYVDPSQGYTMPKGSFRALTTEEWETLRTQGRIWDKPEDAGLDVPEPEEV
jgi:hypothetical protein